MKLETNLKRIKSASEKKDSENWEFRAFLKGYDATIEEIDSVVHELFRKISSEIDCTECANCCKKVQPVLHQGDIRKCSEVTGMTESKFLKKYLKPGKEQGKYIFKEKPCPFLTINICSIYPHRPEVCKSYPHLHKKEFIFRLWGVVENYSICPIVFNVYEQLKVKLRYFADGKFLDEPDIIQE